MLSEPFVPSSHDGTTLTQYELVLIGPSLTSDTLPISYDPRFASFQDEWDDVEFDKTLDLVLGEVLLPLVELSGFGILANVPAAQLRAARQGMRQVYDKHLLGLGVYLRGANDVNGYALAVKYMLGEVATSKGLRLDLLEIVSEALKLSEHNKLSFESGEARLAAQASAAAVTFAVEAALVGGDLTKMVADLTSAPAVASWQAEVMPARFVITPQVATVSRDMSSAKFEVRAIGDAPSGNYRFRWSTSGIHGDLYDLMGSEGVVVDTTSPEIHYFHDTPNDIRPTDVDSILLEVFIVEDGVEAIPPDARPLGKGQAEVRGQGEEEMCVWECDDDGICSIHCP